MTATTSDDEQVLGELRTLDGAGVVRVRHHLGADVRDAWSALTEPARLASWLGTFDGDLRPGGSYRAHFDASGADGLGRVQECTPPHRFLVATTGLDGTGAASFEVSLAAADGGTMVTVEQRGAPLAWLAAFGAGLQVHVEDLAAHLAGRGRCDSDARMGVLVPAYERLSVEEA